MRVFWSVKEAGGGGGGGDQSVPFLDNGPWWHQFWFKLHKQYLIWKLPYSANFWNLIVWPQEVMEVTEVKMKKQNFIQIWNEIIGFCNEKVEKKSILWFSISKYHNLLSVSAKFLKNLSR